MQKQTSSLLRRGVLALLSRDYPAALAAFRHLYQTPNWRVRDTAVTGLGDFFDSRIVEYQKPPSAAQLLMMKTPLPLVRQKKTLSDARLLILLDGFMQPALCQAHTITEQKTLTALREGLKLLEHILLTDKHPLVRMSAVLIFSEVIGQARRPFIQATLETAAHQEQHPALQMLLARLLEV